MKKVFAAGAALLMAGSMATAVELEDNSGVKITGDARARVIYKDKYDFGNSDKDGSMTMDSRVRFNIYGTAAGGAYIHGRIRLAEEKFDGATDSADDDNIYVDKAYIGVPLGDAFTIEAGKYRVSYGNGFLYDDIALSGFRGIYNADNFRIIPFLEVQSEGQVSDNETDVEEDNDSYRFGAAANYQMEDWNIGAIAAYQTDDRTGYTADDGTVIPEPEEDGFFGSVFGKWKKGQFGLEGEFSYAEEGIADFNAGADDGYGGYLRGSWYMDALTMSLDLGFTIDGFKADEYYGFVMVGGDHPITVDNFGDTGDWTWAGLTANYALTEALSLTGNIVYVSIDGNDDVGVTDNRLAEYLEVSGALKYNVAKGTTLSWYAGYLQPDFDGRLDGAGVEDDGAFGTYAKFDVKF